jgi:hypothetical protein
MTICISDLLGFGVVDAADTGDEVETGVVRGLEDITDIELVGDGAMLVLEHDLLGEDDVEVNRRGVVLAHRCIIHLLGTK